MLVTPWTKKMYLKEVLLLAVSFISITVTERKTVSAEKK